jgi:DNA-binding transcriptional regulator YdaS (Cro superfamily)
MKLDEYFKKSGVKKGHLAARIGKSGKYITRLLNGGIPKPKDALLIEEATEGKVTKEELLFPENSVKNSGKVR